MNDLLVQEPKSVHHAPVRPVWKAVSLLPAEAPPAELLARALSQVVARHARTGAWPGAAAPDRLPTMTVVALGPTPNAELERVLAATAWALARCLEERPGPPVRAVCLELGPGAGAILLVAGRASLLDRAGCARIAREVVSRARRLVRFSVPARGERPARG